MLEMQLMQEYGKGAAAVNTRMTVQELYDAYMAAKIHEVRATTYDKTRRNMERYAAYTWRSAFRSIKRCNTTKLETKDCERRTFRNDTAKSVYRATHHAQFCR